MKQKWKNRPFLLAAPVLLCLFLWGWTCLDTEAPLWPGSKAEAVRIQDHGDAQTAANVFADGTYYDAIPWLDGFLAVGNRRVTQVGADGSAKQLLETTEDTFFDIAASDEKAAAVGFSGTVFVAGKSGEITTYSAGEGHAYSSICFFRGRWLAGGGAGWLAQTDDFSNWQALDVPVSGAITGLAATENRCIGITDQGEILITADGISWESFNYNEYYQQSLSLCGIEVLDGMFWAYGTRPDGTSAIILSMEGGVWLERSLVLEGQAQEADLSHLEIGGLCSDGDQAIAALSDGRALTMPSCAVCNKLTKVTDWQPRAIAYGGGKLLFAGDGYQYQLLDAEDVRQEQIQAEAAYEKYRSGALMVDVRTEEEYGRGHIAGSIRIDAGRIAEELPVLCPERSQEIIFYCASGRRSQQALETARELGYLYVYNLGGLENWPYGTEAGSQAQ